MDTSNVHELLKTTCPNPACKRPVEFAAGGQDAPKPGDVMVCFGCLAVQVVDADGLHLATGDELQDLDVEQLESIEEARHKVRTGWIPTPWGP